MNKRFLFNHSNTYLLSLYVLVSFRECEPYRCASGRMISSTISERNLTLQNYALTIDRTNCFSYSFVLTIYSRILAIGHIIQLILRFLPLFSTNHLSIVNIDCFNDESNATHRNCDEDSVLIWNRNFTIRCSIIMDPILELLTSSSFAASINDDIFFSF